MSQDETQQPAPEVPAGEPPGPSGLPGGHLAAGIFLTVGGLSVFAGLLGLLSAEDVRFPANATACGIAFAVLFVAAVAVGPRGSRSAVRGACGVVSVLFLTACYSFVVDLPGPGNLSDDSLRLKLVGAAAVFTVGNLVVGAVVPSAVAGGLAVIGLEGTVLLSLVAAGQTSASALLVAGIVAALAAIVVALRVPRLRPHPTGLAWMVGVGAVLAGLGGTLLGNGLAGLAVATAGALTVSLAVLAWRQRSVAAAIVAVPLLVVVEGYVVTRVAGDSRATGQAVTLIASGAVLVVLVGVGRTLAGRWSAPRGLHGVLVEEVLLGITAVLALTSLAEPSQTGLPFPRGLLGTGSGVTQGGGSGGQFAPQPVPVTPLPVPSLVPPPAPVPISPLPEPSPPPTPG